MYHPKKLIFFITFFTFIIFSFPDYYSAHAYIVKSIPFENQILKTSPKKVRIEFDETIQTGFHSLRVLDMNGKQVDQGDSHIDSKNSSIIECGLKPDLPDGTYRIDWKVVSNDGHPVEGVIPFGVGQVSVDQTTFKAKSKGYFPQLDLIVIRWIQFVSGSVYIGLVFFRSFVIKHAFVLQLEHRYKKIILSSYWLLLLSVVLNLPLQATIEADITWNKVMNYSYIIDLLKTSFFGKVWMIQIIILILLFFTTSRLVRDKEKIDLIWKLSFFLGSGLLLAKAFTSHAFSAEHPFIPIMFDFLHLLGALIWTGSLMAMIILLPLNRMEDSKLDYKQMIRSFFNWGILIVLVLVITGIYSGFSFVTTLDSLFTTNYGRVLLAKVSLFIVMLIFAIINFLKGKTNKEKQWDNSLKGELMTGFIVLVLAVILTNLPTAASTPGPFIETKNLNKDERVTVKIDPRVAGINHFEATIKDKSGKASNSIQQVTLTFIPIEMGSGEDTVILPQISVGRFYSQGMNLNAPGHWKLKVHVLNRDFKTYDLYYFLNVEKQ